MIYYAGCCIRNLNLLYDICQYSVTSRLRFDSYIDIPKDIHLVSKSHSASKLENCVWSKQLCYWKFNLRFYMCTRLQSHVWCSIIGNVWRILTLNKRGPSYIGFIRTISWLLMPWLLTSSGHQQQWYWLYRICWSFSYVRKDFKYLCQIDLEEWHEDIKWKYMFMFLLKNLACKGLSIETASMLHGTRIWPSLKSNMFMATFLPQSSKKVHGQKHPAGVYQWINHTHGLLKICVVKWDKYNWTFIIWTTKLIR